MPASERTANTLALGAALEGSEPLARLMARLRASRACFEAVRQALPAELSAQARPGGFEEGHWTLLACSGAVAAKLRQLQPRLQQALHESGHSGVELRIKVQPWTG